MQTVREAEIEIDALKRELQAVRADRAVFETEVERLVEKKMTGYLVKFGIANAVVAAGLIWAVWTNADSAAKTKAETVANDRVTALTTPLQARIADASKSLREVEKQADLFEGKESLLTKTLENLESRGASIQLSYEKVLKGGTAEDYEKKVTALNSLATESKDILKSLSGLNSQVTDVKGALVTLNGRVDKTLETGKKYRLLCADNASLCLTSPDRDNEPIKSITTHAPNHQGWLLTPWEAP